MTYTVKAVNNLFGSILHGKLEPLGQRSLKFSWFIYVPRKKTIHGVILVESVESCVDYLISDLGFHWFVFNGY